MATDQGMLGQWYDDYLKSTPKTQSYTPVQTTPTEWEADDSQSVAAQVGKITTSGSPLMQQAETRSKQAANARGMLNSSMAIGAAQGALYDAALPMAQQDANTAAQRGQFNANQSTQASQFNAGAQNDSGQFNASEQNKLESARFDVASKMQLSDKDTASKIQLQDNENASRLLLQDKAQADALARMAQQYKDNAGMLELQSKIAEQDFPKQYAATFTSNLMNQVNGFLGDPNLSSEKGPNGEPSPKENAVQNAITFANNSLSWIGKMYNVAFPSMTVPGAAAPIQTNTPDYGPQLPQTPKTGDSEEATTPFVPGEAPFRNPDYWKAIET